MVDKTKAGETKEERRERMLLTQKRILNVFYKIFSAIFGVLFWVTHVFIILLMMFVRIINRILYTFMFYLPKIVGSRIPKKRLVSLDQQLIYAGISMTSSEIVGLSTVYSIALAVTAFLLSLLISLPVLFMFVAALIAFSLVWLIVYLVINLFVDKRTESIESVLPDVLSMVSQNMLAGMTSYNALWTAARPEFGPLAVEVQSVARSTLTGIPLTDALVGMTSRVKSDKLSRTIRLIVQGMKAGGDLPAVLQGVSRDMRMEYNLKKQMASETNAHVVFILFALLIGAPLLFSVSYEFINIFSTLMSKVDVGVLKENAQSSMISLSGLSITPEFFQFYAIAILSVSGFFGALLVGLLRTGKPISGVPNIPVFLFVAVGIFLLMKFALGLFFGGMFAF